MTPCSGESVGRAQEAHGACRSVASADLTIRRFRRPAPQLLRRGPRGSAAPPPRRDPPEPGAGSGSSSEVPRAVGAIHTVSARAPVVLAYRPKLRIRPHADRFLFLAWHDRANKLAGAVDQHAPGFRFSFDEAVHELSRLLQGDMGREGRYV